MTHEEDRLMTIKEVAQKLGITPGAIHQARAAGRILIPAVSISARAVRYRWSDIEKIMRGEARFMRERGESNG